MKKTLKKLNHQIIDLCRVKKLIKLLYWLNLPISIKVHDIFYFNLFQSTANNLLFDQYNKFKLLVVIDSKKEYKVDNILNVKHSHSWGKKVLF